MRLLSTSAEETLNAAGDISSDSPAQPEAVAAVGSRGASPRDTGGYELELIFSGESDGDTDSKKAATDKSSEVAKLEPTKSASRRAMSFTKRHDIFRSSEESDYPSPRRSRSLDSARGGGSGHAIMVTMMQ